MKTISRAEVEPYIERWQSLLEARPAELRPADGRNAIEIHLGDDTWRDITLPCDRSIFESAELRDEVLNRLRA